MGTMRLALPWEARISSQPGYRGLRQNPPIACRAMTLRWLRHAAREIPAPTSFCIISMVRA
jgi:hypothetical protein